MKVSFCYNYCKSEAIIVLARGIEQDGTLSLDTLARVRKAVELYETDQSPTVVMSGKWSFHLTTTPVTSEAVAMKQYAATLGVSADAILVELESMDTIGNAYFTKKLVVEPRGWKHSTVVASDDHIPRVEYLFKKIYGPDYNLSFRADDRAITAKQHKQELDHEIQSMSITLEWLDPIQDGDDAAVWSLLKAQHPAYTID